MANVDYDKRKFYVDSYGHLYPKKGVKGINMNGETITWIEEVDDVPWGKRCNHPQHNPPNMICLHPGQILHHKCPSCGQEHTIRGSGIIM